MFYDDQSPFNGEDTPNAQSLFSNITRPIRNDQTTASRILTFHKNRIFRRREDLPNFYTFTAKEEVEATDNGSPEESVPGNADNSLSDVVDGSSIPNQSRKIRTLIHHGDALWMGTELDFIPLYGETYTDFSISEISPIMVGTAGRYAAVSTPYGLAFFSYDKRCYLFPSDSAPHSEATSSLVHLGRPQQLTFENIDSTDLDNVRLLYYKYGRRDWLVTCFRTKDRAYETWVYDFDVQGWFQLSIGVVSIATVEVTPGNTVLIGGGLDGFTYVLDDLTGTFDGSIITNAINYPDGIYQPALIDFGNPDVAHIPFFIQFETSVLPQNKVDDPPTLEVQAKFWLDPIDVDDLDEDEGRPLQFDLVNIPSKDGKKKAPRWRAFFNRDRAGTTCFRIAIRFTFPASTVNGDFRNFTMYAEPVSDLTL